tara:strand:- start:1997 stop:2635 length:639 start_codon:yes stop_codon:yes gene_type:complete
MKTTQTKTRWWWIRHAPVINPDQKLYGQLDLDVDLSDHKKFELVANSLPKNATWISSPLTRAKETACLLAKLAIPDGKIKEYDQLKEQAFGDWEGKKWDEIDENISKSFWENPAKNCIPNGESFNDLVRRVSKTIDELNNQYSGKDIIAVAHMGTIRAALTHAIGGDGHAGLLFQLKPISLTRIDAIHDNNNIWWKISGVNLYGSREFGELA